jgi:hypothetical protein
MPSINFILMVNLMAQIVREILYKNLGKELSQRITMELYPINTTLLEKKVFCHYRKLF